MPAKIAAPLGLLALVGAALLVPPEPTARSVVADARRAHGSDRLRGQVVRFDFRDGCYQLVRPGGDFVYARTHEDPSARASRPAASDTVFAGALVRDVLTPRGVRRQRDDTGWTPADGEAARITTAVNSVAYFALLPFNLTDPAVRLRRLPDAAIRGEPYRTVEVTFAPNGGGRDWEDRFVYWFHRDRKTMDYLAYLFHTGEGGTRFRVATNPRTVGGVRWQDYENYEDATLGTRIEAYPTRLGTPTLQRVSDVRLERLGVGPATRPDTALACPPWSGPPSA